MIHKTAIIDPKAKISNNVSIGAYTIIGPNVEVGENSDNTITCMYRRTYQNWK